MIEKVTAFMAHCDFCDAHYENIMEFCVFTDKEVMIEEMKEDEWSIEDGPSITQATRDAKRISCPACLKKKKKHDG